MRRWDESKCKRDELGRFACKDYETPEIEKGGLFDGAGSEYEYFPLERKIYNKTYRGNFISDKRFNELTIEVKKLGAKIIRGTEDAIKYLDARGANSVCLGDVLMFRADVCVSEVLEEAFHFKQNLNHINDDKETNLRSILNEIEAKLYLISVKDKYKIPRKETEITQYQLEMYNQQLQNYLKEKNNV